MKSVREWMQDRRVAAAAAAVAALVVGYRFIPGGGAKPSVLPPEATAAIPPAPAAPAPLPAPAPIPLPPAASLPSPGKAWAWERNPFLPTGRDEGAGSVRREGAHGGAGELSASVGFASDLPADLRGTVVSEGSGIAVFGGRLVPLGGRIGEWTLERVEPYGVSLRRGKETRLVELFKPPRRSAGGGGGIR